MNANPERGEVAFQLGEEKGVLCAEMARLAALSGKLGTKTLHEVYERLAGSEPMAMYHAVDCMLIDGDAKALKRNIRQPSDFQIVSEAVLTSLTALIGDPDEKKTTETGSP